MRFTLKIEPDADPQNPRDFDCNVGRMVCFHSRHTLGDKKNLPPADEFKTWGTLRKHLVKEEKAEVILPLYLMDHSGLAISTTPFGCSWDSGQVGWIYSTVKELVAWLGKSWTREQAEKALKIEVEVYNKYISGDVWGYVITDAFGDEVESCWGFYDQDAAEAEGEMALAAIEQRCQQAGHVRLKLELTCSGAAFADDFAGELERILSSVKDKALKQLAREPGCVCKAAEDPDILRDSSGNRVGTLSVTRSL
jgi:hypothetical protein